MKFKKTAFLLIIIFSLSTFTVYAKDSFNASNVYDIIRELTSKKYGGRASGNNGNELAAQYISNYFEDLGLVPAGDGGTYYQEFEIGKTKVKNVLAMIEGTDNNLPPLILSAHFDHLGDLGGAINPGALDNASGTAFIMECARILKNSPVPRQTIIFAAFNAEEAGLVGARYFVEHPTLNIKDAQCLNFDMIGAKPDIPLYITYTFSKRELADNLYKIAKDLSINAEVLDSMRSDHAPFCSNGISAASLIEYDQTYYHTPQDTLKNMDVNKMEKIFKILSVYLDNKGVAFTSTFLIASKDTNTYLYGLGALLLLGGAFILAYRVKIRPTENVDSKR